MQTLLAEGLPLIQTDRVQLQQVILNLIINAVEAMTGVSEGARELLISTGKDASGGVLVAVQDSGSGLNPESFDRLFDAFYTTKPAAWAWDYRSAIRSSKLTGGAYGPPRMPGQASPFNLLCRSTIQPQHRGRISSDLPRRIKLAFANYGVSLRPILVDRPAPRACFSRHFGPGPRI